MFMIGPPAAAFICGRAACAATACPWSWHWRMGRCQYRWGPRWGRLRSIPAIMCTESSPPT